MGNIKNYSPNPIDLSELELPADLKKLTEKIAENVHDVWAKSRFKDGWIYGIHRNDALKTHPGLVAYDDLSESEKEYDRKTAMDTLKFVIAQGYEIKKIQSSDSLNKDK